MVAKVKMDFEVYASGLTCCSVCTTLEPEAATERLNRESPTGLDHGWKVAPRPFKCGAPNPGPCDTHPETHRHMLFEC